MSSFESLKYDWLTPINRLKYEPTAHAFIKLSRVISFSEWFVQKWADWAELAQMQPVHLLRYDPDDLAGRGLAWRWTDVMDVLCWPLARTMVAESLGTPTSPTLFVYRFLPDGRTVHLFGEERRQILQGHMELQQLPGRVEKARAEDFE